MSVHPRSGRVACPGCNRKFKGVEALGRHLDRNPEHEVSSERFWSGEWVVKDESVETFRRMPERLDKRTLSVTHDTSTNTVHVDGPTQTTFDTTAIADEITGDPRFKVRGEYLIVSFRRESVR